jgi:hypothetical protein
MDGRWLSCLVPYTALERDVHPKATELLKALVQLSTMVNATQLGVRHEQAKFRLRHGVAYEPDALLCRLPSGALEIIGRNVTLAFRLAGIPAEYPGLTAHRTVIEPFAGVLPSPIRVTRWRPNSDELLKYFKGERWGTTALYKSTGHGAPRPGFRKTVKELTDITAKADEVFSKLRDPTNEPLLQALRNDGVPADEATKMPAPTDTDGKITYGMLTGPKWAREAVLEYVGWAEKLVGSLKTAAELLPKLKALVGPNFGRKPAAPKSTAGAARK